MPKFNVLREHWGDKVVKGATVRHRYKPGEVREVESVTGEIEAQLQFKILGEIEDKKAAGGNA